VLARFHRFDGLLSVVGYWRRYDNNVNIRLPDELVVVIEALGVTQAEFASVLFQDASIDSK